MEGLRDNFRKLKEKIEKEEQKDREKRKAFLEALFVVFEGKAVEKFVKEFFFKKGVMFLKTANKSFAQELGFRRIKLAGEMNRKRKIVDKIVIF